MLLLPHLKRLLRVQLRLSPLRRLLRVLPLRLLLPLRWLLPVVLLLLLLLRWELAVVLLLLQLLLLCRRWHGGPTGGIRRSLLPVWCCIAVLHGRPRLDCRLRLAPCPLLQVLLRGLRATAV